MGRLTTRRNSE